MASYTNFFEEKAYNVLSEDNLAETLRQCAKAFRTFDEALDTFIFAHGYAGEVDDVEGKESFIKSHFKAGQIPVPRNINRWYTEHILIERRTAFQICFAFHLTIEETEDFMRRICLIKGIDCHNMEELVYSFAIKNGLSYSDAKEIIDSVDLEKPCQKMADEPVYTELIQADVEDIQTKEQLIAYLNENAAVFCYNNATVTQMIQTFWSDIANSDGLAIRERRKLYISFDDDSERYNKAHARDSIWNILLQILGLLGSYSEKRYKDRSLKSILRDNELLHPLAECAFPDRDGLNKVLLGRHVSYERIRKLLILLVFYRFWAIKALAYNDYEAKTDDTKRCILAVNESLIDAGYPALYPGNPYDFIFLVALNSEYPLLDFREIMREIYFSACVGV